jgi:hypothetical protein
MLKYIYTLATLLDSKSKIRKHYSPETVISDLFDEDLDEIDFIKSLSELELIYGFEIPEDLYDKTDLTLGEFADELSHIPVIPDELYPEFFDMTKRYIELENKTDAYSVREKNEISKKFDELTLELNMLMEYENKIYLMN